MLCSRLYVINLIFGDHFKLLAQLLFMELYGLIFKNRFHVNLVNVTFYRFDSIFSEVFLKYWDIFWE